MPREPEPARDVEAQLAAVRGDVGELLRRLRLVGQQVHWLMDNALITADAPICDLDGDIDQTMVDLAATVERGERFQDELLDGVTGKRLRLAIERHAEWQRRRAEQHTAIVALSEAVVGKDPAAAARAAADFPAAARALRELEQDGPRLEAAAQEAARRLDADDTARREHRTDIAAVADAWQQLCRQLRAVIDEGVAKHALFPEWFRNSLGLAPPPGQPTRWFELATEIRAYRITYGVVNQDSPLGAPPPEDASRRRQEWYRRLRAGMARLR